MNESYDVYRATVEELFQNFRRALLAIRPIAEQAMINYLDEDTHRDWERIAEALFDAFVRGPLDADRSRVGDELPLSRYDIDVDDYADCSWLASDAESPHHGAVVRFLSQDSPFDTVQLVDIDPGTLRPGGRRTVSWDAVKPVVYRRRQGGEVTVMVRVEAVE